MSVKFTLPLLASIALCIAAPFSVAQSAATSGPANPKEVGKPGTAANSGTGMSGAMNGSDAKGANASADGASSVKKRMDSAKQKRAAEKASLSGSSPGQ